MEVRVFDLQIENNRKIQDPPADTRSPTTLASSGAAPASQLATPADCVEERIVGDDVSTLHCVNCHSNLQDSDFLLSSALGLWLRSATFVNV